MTARDIKLSNGDMGAVLEGLHYKCFRSPQYNFNFDKRTGFFNRWGRTFQDDGDPALGVPELLDMEISTICSEACHFCYKDNRHVGCNMPLKRAIEILDQLPLSICQVAYGIGSVDANPDLFPILHHTRRTGLVPNITISPNITQKQAQELVSVCGAIAVSLHDPEPTYRTVEMLTSLGCKQVNLHIMISNETYDRAKQTLLDYACHPCLQKVNAFVLLNLKQKGRAAGHFTTLDSDKFASLIDLALDKKIPFGMDSCGGYKLQRIFEQRRVQRRYFDLIEPCESSLYSVYINVAGEVFPCSFIEGTSGWEQGLSVRETGDLGSFDFMRDIWYSTNMSEFRKKALDCRRRQQNCVFYNI